MPRRHHRDIEQLAALLDGSRAPEDVGAPARRLGALATAVIEREPFEAVALAEDRRLAIRDQLLDQIAEEAAAPATTPVLAPAREQVNRGVRSARGAIATGLAAATLGTTGMAFAAQEALPGDTLYRVKQVTESARLSLAGDVTQQGRLQLRFAEERLDEVVTGHDRIGQARLVTAMQEMDERSVIGAEALIDEAARTDDGALLAEVDDFTRRQATRLVDLYDQLPPQVRPHVEDSLGVLRRIRLELLFPAVDACDCVQLAGNVIQPLSESASLTDRLRSAALPTPTSAQTTTTLSSTLQGYEAEALARVESSFDDTRDGDGSRSGDGAGTRVGSGTNTIVGDTGGAVNETTDQLGDTVDDTTDTLRETTDAVTGGTGQVGDTVEEVGDGVGDTVRETGDTIGRVTDSVGEAVEDTGSTVDDTVDSVVDSVVDNSTDAVDKTVDGIGGVLGGG